MYQKSSLITAIEENIDNEFLQNTILESIINNSTRKAIWTKELEFELICECDDYSNDLEFWGTIEENDKKHFWKIKLDKK
jgi:hypothetical protein